MGAGALLVRLHVNIDDVEGLALRQEAEPQSRSVKLRDVPTYDRSIAIWIFSTGSTLERFLPRCMQCRRGLTMRILSVRPSVRLSVKRVICDKMEERSVQIFMSHERSFSLVFWEEEWLVGGDHFYLKSWVNRPTLERNRRFSTDIRP